MLKQSFGFIPKSKLNWAPCTSPGHRAPRALPRTDQPPRAWALKQTPRDSSPQTISFNSWDFLSNIAKYSTFVEYPGFWGSSGKLGRCGNSRPTVPRPPPSGPLRKVLGVGVRRRPHPAHLSCLTPLAPVGGRLVAPAHAQGSLRTSPFPMPLRGHPLGCQSGRKAPAPSHCCVPGTQGTLFSQRTVPEIWGLEEARASNSDPSPGEAPDLSPTGRRLPWLSPCLGPGTPGRKPTAPLQPLPPMGVGAGGLCFRPKQTGFPRVLDPPASPPRLPLESETEVPEGRSGQCSIAQSHLPFHRPDPGKAHRSIQTGGG